LNRNGGGAAVSSSPNPTPTPSTVQSKSAQARRKARTIKYASITTGMCPRVPASVRTNTGRTSQCVVLQVRNARSTAAKSW